MRFDVTNINLLRFYLSFGCEEGLSTCPLGVRRQPETVGKGFQFLVEHKPVNNSLSVLLMGIPSIDAVHTLKKRELDTGNTFQQLITL